MAVQVPKLKRGLFGYRPSIVRTILVGREIMFAKVWQRLHQVEADRDAAKAELEASRAEIDVKAERARLADEQRAREAERARRALAEAEELRSVNERLRARIDHLDAEAAEAASARGGAPGPEDLWTDLERAERSITEVIERARRENERQLEAIEAARREVRAEAERLAVWRAEANSILGTVRAALAKLAGVAARLPDGSEAGAIPAAMIRLPEVSENGRPDSNGAVALEELAAIQELYGSG
jgi:chromosome segregation ATPase